MSPAHSTGTKDSDEEYRSIEQTLLASARGRWFLAEHGRRARRLDNALLEDAVSRLSASLKEPTALAERLKSQLNLVQEALREVTATVAARHRSNGLAASDVRSPSGTCSPPTIAQCILNASEQVHELAWTLQGRVGHDVTQRALEQIGRQVIAIYALARKQAGDLETSQDLLGRLAIAEERVAGMIETIDHELNARPAPPNG